MESVEVVDAVVPLATWWRRVVAVAGGAEPDDAGAGVECDVRLKSANPLSNSSCPYWTPKTNSNPDLNTNRKS